MSGVLRTVLRGVVAASLALVSTPAAAAPPEGCVGFPDIPDAWICITSWTPQNVVPRAGTTDGTTFVVPQFCAFSECVGPTPVTVPGVYAGQGGGAIATITYRDQTVTVPVAVAPVVRLSATVTLNCFGCGPSFGSASGVFTGVIGGHSYAGATMSGSVFGNVPSALCQNPVGSGTMSMSLVASVSDGTSNGTFELNTTSVGPAVIGTFPAGSSITGAVTGIRVVTTPIGHYCYGGPVTMYVDLTGTLIA